MICLIIFGEEYKLWSSLVFNFLHSPVTLSLLGPNIFLRYLFPDKFLYEFDSNDTIITVSFINLFVNRYDNRLFPLVIQLFFVLYRLINSWLSLTKPQMNTFIHSLPLLRLKYSFSISCSTRAHSRKICAQENTW
jgi:hypothetical protein